MRIGYSGNGFTFQYYLVNEIYYLKIIKAHRFLLLLNNFIVNENFQSYKKIGKYLLGLDILKIK
jgi:hypothetical protein